MPFATDGGGALNTSAPVALNAVTATPVFPSRSGRPFRTALLLQNQSTIDIYWSEKSTVTTSGATQGWLIKGNQTVPIGFTDVTMTSPIYAIAASGTPNLNAGEVLTPLSSP